MRRAAERRPGSGSGGVLSFREFGRALLARQLLLRRERLSVPRVVERLGALQAQYSPSPYVALWSRLDGFAHDELTRALERRQVVKASLMRVTLHLLSARDYLAPAPCGSRRGGRRSRAAARGRPGRPPQAARERGALTLEELRDLVWPERRSSPASATSADGCYRDVARNGDVRTTFLLVDGFAGGTWREEEGRVALEPFAPLPLQVRRESRTRGRGSASSYAPS